MSAVDKSPVVMSDHEDREPFGNFARRAIEALQEAVAERRRNGLPITVDRGHGVERVP